MSGAAKPTVTTRDGQFAFTRLFDAPRERVFRAWVDPVQLARWWGPHTFTVPDCETDPRPGGRFRIVMRSPEGVDFAMRAEYLDVVEPEKIVYRHNLDELPEWWREHLKATGRAPTGSRTADATVTLTFEERGDKTLMTLVSRFSDDGDRDAFLELGAAEGWEESFQKMDALLASS